MVPLAAQKNPWRPRLTTQMLSPHHDSKTWSTAQRPPLPWLQIRQWLLGLLLQLCSCSRLLAWRMGVRWTFCIPFLKKKSNNLTRDWGCISVCSGMWVSVPRHMENNYILYISELLLKVTRCVWCVCDFFLAQHLDERWKQPARDAWSVEQ